MSKYSSVALVVVAALFIAGLVTMPYDENQQFVFSDPKSKFAILLMIPGIIFATVASIRCYKEERRLEKGKIFQANRH